MPYKHTQIGYLMIIVVFAVAVCFGIVFTRAGLDPTVVPVLLLVLFLISSFVSLNVEIDGNHLRIKFGYGIFRKRFTLSEIISAKKTRNHWYYGFGMRVWLWPYMWIFNISGLDAVEIKMKNGRIYRIGTDEPEKLEFAIQQAIK